MPGELRTRELIGDTFVVTHTVDDSHDGWRADNYLRYQYDHFSRNKLQKLIDEGRIIIDGKKLKASTTLRPGDEIQVLSERTEEPPVDLNFKVLFEDEDVLVVDKPGNLPVHPAGKFLFNTLLMELRRLRGHDFHMIHRIDRETSGVLVVGKNPSAASWLTKQFREKKTEKRYYAIAEGHCEESAFQVDSDLGSDKNSFIRLKMAAFPKGQGTFDALTLFKVVKRGGNVDLLDCELKTGRQHQIRVHLASIKHPVVGDKLYGMGDAYFLDYLHNRLEKKPEAPAVYGSPSARIARHALHSRYIRFFHEKLDKWLEVESPLPKDMEALL